MSLVTTTVTPTRIVLSRGQENMILAASYSGFCGILLNIFLTFDLIRQWRKFSREKNQSSNQISNKTPTSITNGILLLQLCTLISFLFASISWSIFRSNVINRNAPYCFMGYLIAYQGWGLGELLLIALFTYRISIIFHKTYSKKIYISVYIWLIFLGLMIIIMLPLVNFFFDFLNIFFLTSKRLCFFFYMLGNENSVCLLLWADI